LHTLSPSTYQRTRRCFSPAGASGSLVQFCCSRSQSLRVDTARIWWVTLEKRLPWSSHIDQVRKKAVQKLEVLGSILNRRGLSIRNGVLLYRQLIRPIIDYACSIWRSPGRSHITKLQVLQSKCLRIATGDPWYNSNSQIREDLGVAFFADHIKALTESLDSADAGNSLVRQIFTLTEG
jgi:hypothetical protein